MDKEITGKEIIESFDCITIEKELSDTSFLFCLYKKEFIIFLPDRNIPQDKPIIFLYNDEGFDYPHIMLRNYPIPKSTDLPIGTYRWICLYEEGSVVNTIISYEDKIIDAIERLIELLSMTQIEREREFQKEFMFYWNSVAKDIRTNLYLQRENSCSELYVYYGENEIRLIEKGKNLSDIDLREKMERKWILHIEKEAYYIPLIDNRGILPPHRGYEWTAETIKNIIYGKQIEHISDETYKYLLSANSKTQNVLIVFGMKNISSECYFCVEIRFKSSQKGTLLSRLLNDIILVVPRNTKRRDYSYLCKQIGNKIGTTDKTILLIGAGSLGSYVAFELVKNGYNHLRIFDGDDLEKENVLRWAYGGVGLGKNKATNLKILLEALHPEITIDAFSMDMEEKKLVNEIQQDDMVICTIGNSDTQLKFNRLLKSSNCQIPIIYSWIEEGGIYSHILTVDYNNPGCFECLYTGSDGEFVNNRARKNTEENASYGIIRNGCGGTRAAYGTAVLLRTTAAILETIKTVETDHNDKNTLVDISPDGVSYTTIRFPMEVCNCCGNTVKE